MKLITTLFLVFLFIPIEAQIKSKKIDVDNIKSILKEKGYEMHSYDLSALLDKDYNISIYVQSSDSTDRHSFNIEMGPNRRLISSMSAVGKADYLKSKPKDKKHYAKAKQLSIYLLPYNDSIKTLVVEIPDVKRYSCRIKLKPQTNGRDTAYIYHCESIDPSQLSVNTRTPLLFYGSYWWDAQANLFRFCGVPDVSTGITSCDLSAVPHYYVIGIEITDAR